MNSALFTRLSALVLSLGALSPMALAQETTITPTPAQPGEGRFSISESFRYLSFDHDPTSADRDRIDQFEIRTAFAVGLTHDLALNIEAPVVFRNTSFNAGRSDRSDEGMGSVTALLRWRIWQNDFGPVDTARLGVYAGARIGSGNDVVSGDSADPIVGAAFMLITGRHGINFAVDWMFTTEDDDAPVLPGDTLSDLLRVNGAYLFRIYPEEYTAESNASWYLVAELNGLYETNGDTELFVSPGILYEARRWAAELVVQIPVYQELEYRPETRIAIVAGLRFLF